MMVQIWTVLNAVSYELLAISFVAALAASVCDVVAGILAEYPDLAPNTANQAGNSDEIAAADILAFNVTGRVLNIVSSAISIQAWNAAADSNYVLALQEQQKQIWEEADKQELIDAVRLKQQRERVPWSGRDELEQFGQVTESPAGD